MSLHTLIYPSLALVVLGLFVIQRVISFVLLEKRPSILITLYGVLLLTLSALASSGLPTLPVLLLDVSFALALDIMWMDYKLGPGVVGAFALLAVVAHVIWLCDAENGRMVLYAMAVLGPLVRIGPYLLRISLRILIIKDFFGSIFALLRKDFKPSSWWRVCGAAMCMVISLASCRDESLAPLFSCLAMICMMAVDMVDSYSLLQSRKREVEKLPPNARQEEKYQEMVHLFKTEKIYLEPDFSLRMLAEKLGTNQSYVSCLLNSYLNMTFPQLRNALRMEYAIKIINENPSLKVEKVSLQCGYGTLVTFEREFKKKTGQSPSEYIKGVRAMRALGHSPSPSKSQGQVQSSGLPFSLLDE